MSAKKPPAADDHCTTETDDGATAALRKRGRRVSFAEITSVHVFDRDDEYETPPEPEPDHGLEVEQFNRELGFLIGDGNLRDEEDAEDIDEVDAGRLFLRPVESPGSAAGSAASNDDDNFFGPVSTSFIKPGRLSDSGTLDNHDITMDSTAFSQHFNSLAKSDSGEDLKTPTGVQLFFEENTPSQNSIPGSNLGNSMLLNSAKKPVNASSTSIDKLSGGSGSNDMSLVEDNPNRYDYGRLSFGWDALLAEGVQDLHTSEIVPISNKNISTQSPIHPQSRRSLSKRRRERTELNKSGVENFGPTDIDHMVVELAPFADKLDDTNGDREPNHTRNEILGNHMISEVAHFAGKLEDVNGHRESTVPNDISGKKVGRTHTDHVIVEAPLFADRLVGTNDNLSSSPIHNSSLAFFDELNQSSELLIQRMLSTTESDALEIGIQADSRVNSGTAANQESEIPHLDASLHDESPLARSLSSLSEQRQADIQVARVSKTLLTSTPQNHVLHESDGIGRKADTVPSVQKSISKLRMLDASPFASNLNVKKNPVFISSESLYRTPPFNTSLYRNKEDADIKHVDASAAWEDRGNRGRNTISNMKLNSVKYLTSPALRSTEVLASEQSSELARVKSLLFQLTWSGKKTKMNLLASENPSGRIVVTPGRNSFFSKITHDHQKIIKAAGTPYKSVHSLEEGAIKKSASKEFQDITSKDDESKTKIIDQRYDVDRRDNLRNASLSTTIVKELDSAFREIAHSSPPLSETNHMKECTGLQTTSPLEIEFHDVRDESRLERSSQSFTNENSRYLILNENLKTGEDPGLSKHPTGECLKSSFVSPPSVNEDDSDPSSLKKLMESPCRSPLRKRFYNTVQDDKLNSAALEKPLLPNADQLAYEYDDLSARKRTWEDVMSGGSMCVNELGRLQRSPKVHKSVGREFEVLSGHHNGTNKETAIVGNEPTMQHWTDVLSDLLTKKMLPPSTDRLHSQAIGVLEDKLVKLQRLQAYEMRHSVIQSQKSVDILANLQRQRAGETKILLHRIMHEHAKLQLMRVKQEKLQRNVQLLKYGIQESQLLKKNSLPRINARCIKDANVDGSHCQSINIMGEEEVPGKKATELRQLRDTLESKLKSLTKSVHSSCKLKGISSHSDTVSAVDGYLKKKACCKFLRSDMQLWKVHNIFNMNGSRSLVLNYLDFVTQRITVKAGSASNIVISNELNDSSILKSFPSMDAWTALSFAFSTMASQKYVGLPSLTQETQITSTVLGNLVDIAEEVQQAHLELQNLTYTRFVSPSVGKLDLHFQFVGMKSGRIISLTLDMSCLQWGIYPSDIMPYKLEGSSESSREPLPEQLSAEIRAAVQNLSVGYCRILRMCTTVSQVVQAWSG